MTLSRKRRREKTRSKHRTERHKRNKKGRNSMPPWCTTHSTPLRFVGVDQFGHRFRVVTEQQLTLHPGFATVVAHKAYPSQKLIVVGVCFSWERAIKMHEYWMDVLVRGPLPDALEDIGMGVWKDGRILVPRSQRYSKGGT